jgi:NAD(P)-dependent dehydrogenase (short-subunit alcohol dehydrogenase family)
LERIEGVEEIASVIVFLASPRAANITDPSLSIDGGSTAGH